MQDKKKLKIKKFPIKINSNGEWFYNNTLIKRKELIKLFSSVLKADNKGNFFLETPAEKGSIEVEDSPFVIISYKIINQGPKQKIIFKTNLDEEIILGDKNPLIFKKKRKSFIPYLVLNNNLEARILRSVYYLLANKSLKKKNQYSIISQGRNFELK